MLSASGFILGAETTAGGVILRSIQESVPGTAWEARDALPIPDGFRSHRVLSQR